MRPAACADACLFTECQAASGAAGTWKRAVSDCANTVGCAGQLHAARSNQLVAACARGATQLGKTDRRACPTHVRRLIDAVGAPRPFLQAAPSPLLEISSPKPYPLQVPAVSTDQACSLWHFSPSCILRAPLARPDECPSVVAARPRGARRRGRRCQSLPGCSDNLSTMSSTSGAPELRPLRAPSARLEISSPRPYPLPPSPALARDFCCHEACEGLVSFAPCGSPAPNRCWCPLKSARAAMVGTQTSVLEAILPSSVL